MVHSSDEMAKPYTSDLAQAAKNRLTQSPYAAIFQRLSCHCDEGHLTLRGQLPSFYHKQLAQETVGNVDGITRVINETEVVEANVAR